MAKITSKMLEFVKTGYSILKDEEGDSLCHYDLRENDGRYMDFLLLKNDWYHSGWSLFESGVYVVSFCPKLLDTLIAKNKEG